MTTAMKDKWQVATENWATIQKIAPKVTDGWDSPDEMSDDELAVTSERIDDYIGSAADWNAGRIGARGETDGLSWIRFDGVQLRKGNRRIESLFVIGLGDVGSVVLTQW